MLKLLLIPALLGYYLAYVLYVRRSTAFFPAVLVSLSALSVYVSGLLGSLMPGVLAVLAAGCILLGLSVWRLLRHPGELGTVRASVLSVETLFLLVSVCAAYFITRDSTMSHWDDFSHWFRICKMMNAENALPTQPDMKFPTYVPGTACFIYFITRFVGFAQDKCIFAQSLMNIAFCMSLLSVIPRQLSRAARRVSFLVVCLTAIMLCGVELSVFSLLVDALVALAPIAAVLIVFDETDDGWTLPMAVLSACFGALIKTSGLLFCLFIAAAYVFRRRKDWRTLAGGALLFLLPLGLMLWYQARANALYLNVAATGQAVSPERYLAILSGRSADDIVQILLCYLKNIFMLHAACDQVLLLWVFAAALIVLWAGAAAFGHERLAKSSGRAIAAVAAAIAAYSVGLVATYVCSMRGEEANGGYLTCFGRYFSTCTIFVCGLVVAYMLWQFCRLPTLRHRMPALVLLLGLVFFSSSTLTHPGYIFGWLFDEPYEAYIEDLNVDMGYALPQHNRYDGGKYAVVLDADQYSRYGALNLYYANDIAQMQLRSPDVFCFDINALLEGTLTGAETALLMDCDRLYLLNEELEEQVRAVLPISERISDTTEYTIVWDDTQADGE